VVCNPRRNALLKEGSKNDKVDARKLDELLRTIYHGENGLRTLRELARVFYRQQRPEASDESAQGDVSKLGPNSPTTRKEKSRQVK